MNKYNIHYGYYFIAVDLTPTFNFRYKTLCNFVCMYCTMDAYNDNKNHKNVAIIEDTNI